VAANGQWDVDNSQADKDYTDAVEGPAGADVTYYNAVDQAIRDSGRFPNEDAAWEIDGVAPELGGIAPNALAPVEPITGRVVQANGAGVGGVLVLLHSRFRNSLDCSNPSREADAGYSEVFDFAESDAAGRFVLNRPAGIYQLVFASDGFAFRPEIINIETPLEDIQVLAEPL